MEPWVALKVYLKGAYEGVWECMEAYGKTEKNMVINYTGYQSGVNKQNHTN